jgi:hypothetical protein
MLTIEARTRFLRDQGWRSSMKGGAATGIEGDSSIFIGKEQRSRAAAGLTTSNWSER